MDQWTRFFRNPETVRRAVAAEDYEEGDVVRRNPAVAVVVMEDHITERCSCCLQKPDAQHGSALLRCSECSFIRYCSVKCQRLDWTAYHKDECKILPVLLKTLRPLPTDIARLFVRLALNTQTVLRGQGLPPTTQETASRKSELYAEAESSRFTDMNYCKTVFIKWRPFLKVMTGGHTRNMRYFGSFMMTLSDLKEISFPLYANTGRYEAKHIACGLFRESTTFPAWRRNVVLITTIDPVLGPLLTIKAMRSIKAREPLCFPKARDLLTDHIWNVKLECVYPIVYEPFSRCATRTAYARQLEVRCRHCEIPLGTDTGIHEYCPLCDTRTICTTTEWETVLKGIAAVSKKRSLGTDDSTLTLQLEIERLKYIIRPFVANSSFALAILYRLLVQINELNGKMDEAVKLYKQMFPIVEMHLDKFDQNIFDGLSRVIVFHLERNELTKALPFIKIAWILLSIIPGKDSFDFYVVDRLLKAVRLSSNFSFAAFCDGTGVQLVKVS